MVKTCISQFQIFQEEEDNYQEEKDHTKFIIYSSSSDEYNDESITIFTTDDIIALIESNPEK